jgi:hypothetical protein
MKYRTFGRLGWPVSEIGYGMWGMGSWSGSDDQQSLQALQRAVDRGCNFFDTAWAYGSGRSEGLLGQLVRANPGKKIYTATKIPPKNRRWPSRREHTLDDCYPPEYVAEYLQEPGQRRPARVRPDPAPHLGGPLAVGPTVRPDGGRAARLRPRRRRRDQRQPLGAVERR